jgi:DNA-binding XRE family transcriptional regulator
MTRHGGDIEGYMLLPRDAWETALAALAALERLGRMDAAPTLTGEPLRAPGITDRDLPVPRPGLAEARKRAGYTQQSLGSKVGVSKHTICQWETGNNTPSPSNRLKLAAALSLSLDELHQLLAGRPLPPSDGVWLERLIRADPDRARQVLADLAEPQEMTDG